MKVKNYKLKTTLGNSIRTATKVVFDNGEEIRFMEILSKKQALHQALSQIKKLSAPLYQIPIEEALISGLLQERNKEAWQRE